MITYEKMVKEVESGQLIMGVEPAVARRFYTDLTTSQREELVGDSQAEKSNMVRNFFMLEHTAVLTAAVASIFAFHWWAFLFIPGFVILCWFWKSGASFSSPSFGPSFLLIALLWGVAFYFHAQGIAFIVLLVTAPLPHLFSRLVHHTATHFLAQLAMENSRAYAYFTDGRWGQRGVFFKNATTGEMVE